MPTIFRLGEKLLSSWRQQLRDPDAASSRSRDGLLTDRYETSSENSTPETQNNSRGRVISIRITRPTPTRGYRSAA